MLVYIQMTIVLILCFVSSISDFKNQKIYNRYIAVGIVLSTITYIVFLRQIDGLYAKSFIINLIITSIISFAFFYFKIWGAGDAKLFIAIVYMIPYDLYELDINNYFASIYLLIFIFSSAFIYVFFETIFLFVKDKNKFDVKKYYKTFSFKRWIYDYFFGYSFSLLFNNLIFWLVPNFFLQNRELIFMINALLLVFIYRLIKSYKKKNVIFVSLLVMSIISCFIKGFEISIYNSIMLIVIFFILLFKDFSEKYNYKTIYTSDLKERMILSIDSVIPFYSSRVNGLPKYSDESTDCRLTREEVESIKRWSKTSKGLDQITIVRHMPFAPFMFVGVLFFYCIKLLF